MSTVTSSTATSASSVLQQLSGSAASASQGSDAASADRFLKLLVTQMQNQDPLSPMDNAQVTSQMAQINTVSGINTLNTSINAMGAQFTQMQALQGAALVGRGVLVEGNQLTLGSDGQASAAFDLAGAADAVKVEVLSPAGRVIDTINVGAETTGRHSFSWSAPQGSAAGSAYTFRVAATSGATNVAATPLMRDQVQAVSTSGSTLNLELKGGKTLPYGQIRAFS
ncbi:MAG: flagellar hook assembly protein FlgD [Leptothrix sp. (in: b-proteobacteria)]